MRALVLKVDQLLDSEGFIETAEKSLLLEGKSEFFFSVRRKSNISNFYDLLEKELRAQILFTVSEYRVVKEGWTKISRPAVLRIDRATLIKQKPHLTALEREISRWRIDFSSIGASQIITIAYKDVVADPALTNACLEVLLYLINNREIIKGLLPRQVQHKQSTKLIGQEPLLLKMFGIWRQAPAHWADFFRFFELTSRSVEFRFFAPNCLCQSAKLSHFHGVLSHDWHNDFKFDELRGTLIVENLETFHSESARSQDRLIIWGGGWRVILLRTFQKNLPRPILYWGDIDKEGYEIYGTLKGYISDLQTTLMAKTTIDKHVQLATTKEPFFGPFREVQGLQEEYQEVCRRGLCIEQEKIHDLPYVASS
jgi:hypothetical protein